MSEQISLRNEVFTGDTVNPKIDDGGMTISLITRTQAERLTGTRKLPAGMRWYQVSGLQFYPNYGAWSFTWAGDDGLNAVIAAHRQRQPEAGSRWRVVVSSNHELSPRWRQFKEVA